MIEWHRFVQPVADESRTQSSMTLQDGTLLVNCGDTDVLVGVSGDARHVNVRLNGESHQYERGLVNRVVVNGGRGNHDIELADQVFDMLVVAHGTREMQSPRREDGGDLHTWRAKRHRADDFGLV
jgi:hypothetical protein